MGFVVKRPSRMQEQCFFRFRAGRAAVCGMTMYEGRQCLKDSIVKDDNVWRTSSWRTTFWTLVKFGCPLLWLDLRSVFCGMTSDQIWDPFFAEWQVLEGLHLEWLVLCRASTGGQGIFWRSCPLQVRRGVFSVRRNLGLQLMPSCLLTLPCCKHTDNQSSCYVVSTFFES